MRKLAGVCRVVRKRARKTDERREQLESPTPGRKREMELRARKDHRKKKLKMATEVLDLQKRHILELKRHNDIQLFTSGPGGAESDMVRQFFKLKQEDVCLPSKNR